MGVVPQYDSATRAGKGPEFNYAGQGPGLISTSLGTEPNWASLVYTNTLGTNAQQVGFRLHNCNATDPATDKTQSFVKAYIIPPGLMSVTDAYEIYNVGLVPTETWESPKLIPINPGCSLLLLNTGSDDCTFYLDIYSIV
jgi:hypothetical protein